jgi:hypothetical protein
MINETDIIEEKFLELNSELTSIYKDLLSSLENIKILREKIDKIEIITRQLVDNQYYLAVLKREFEELKCRKFYNLFQIICISILGNFLMYLLLYLIVKF